MALLSTARKPKTTPVLQSQEPAAVARRATSDMAQSDIPEVFIPIERIQPPIHNPRRHFDATAMEELTESIRQDGVMTPVLLRRLDDGTLRLVAGERRFRAATAAGLSHLPALIRVMNDIEERRFALIENTHREPMTETEESDRAAKVLEDCKGDLAEAAKRLGWKPNKLERRLALQNLIREAVDAFESKALSLKHAELLAGVSQEIQQEALDLALREQLDIEALRKVLLSKSCNLARACFEKAECASCASNSSRQQDFFSTTLDESAICTKPSCFEGKTEAHLRALHERLTPVYPVVRIVRIGDVQPVLVTPETVSETQHAACQMCGAFGAAIYAIPGREGTLVEGGCFDLACNAEKRAERRKAQEQAQRAQVAVEAGESPAATAAANDAPPCGIEQDIDDEVEPSMPASLTRRMREYREGVWREAVASHLESGCEDAPVQAQAAQSLAQRIRHGMIDLESVRLMGAGFGVDVCRAFAFDKAFLDLLAATEIRGVCESVGLGDHVRQMKGGKRQFLSLTSGAKDEIVAAVLSVPGFDYVQAVPVFMQFAQGVVDDAQ